MRILHVINSIDPRSGGPLYAIRHLVEEQLRRGYALHVVTTDIQAGVGGIPREQFRQSVLTDDVWQRVGLTMTRSVGRGRPWNHLGFTPAARRAIKKAIEELKPDLLHVHGVFGWITSAACRVSYRSRIPFILEPYGAYDPLCLWSHSWPLKWAWHVLWGRWELLHAATIKVASEYEAKPFRKSKNLNHKITVIPYGVTLSVDMSDGKPNYPLVCFISRITKKKRPEWVVAACEMLRNEFPTLKVVIAGSDDGHRKFLEDFIRRKRAETWVEVHDFVEGDAKKELLRQASVLVLPSRDESFGAIVLEALAAGIPAVVTPGVAAGEHVIRSGCGLLVEDTVQHVAEGICAILKSDRAALGRRGREYVKRHLTWRAVADELEAVYRKVGQCRKA